MTPAAGSKKMGARGVRGGHDKGLSPGLIEVLANCWWLVREVGLSTDFAEDQLLTWCGDVVGQWKEHLDSGHTKSFPVARHQERMRFAQVADWDDFSHF